MAELFLLSSGLCNGAERKNLPPIWITLPDGELVRSDDPQRDNALSTALKRKVTLRNSAPEKPILEQFWPEYAGQSNEVSQEAVAGDAPKGTFLTMQQFIF